MRCLRCAIEYGPDEQFCQRCGRALSRPLGSKPAPEETPEAARPDGQFFYTTTAPPPLQGTTRATGDPVDWEMPASPGMMSRASVLEPPTQAPALKTDLDEDEFPAEAVPIGEDSAAEPSLPDQGMPPLPVDLSPRSGTMLKRATGGLDPGILHRPPPTPDSAPVPVPQAPVKPPDDFFGDESDDDSAALLGPGFSKGGRPSAVGGTGQMRGDQRAGRRNLRALPLVIIVAVVIVALGGYAYTRQRTYNSDLSTATGLAQQGRYLAAINMYNQAIAAWPFNSAAKDGLSAAQAAQDSIQAAAHAAAQAQAQFDSTRQAMYDAHMALIQQEVASSP